MQRQAFEAVRKLRQTVVGLKRSFDVRFMQYTQVMVTREETALVREERTAKTQEELLLIQVCQLGDLLTTVTAQAQYASTLLLTKPPKKTKHSEDNPKPSEKKARNILMTMRTTHLMVIPEGCPQHQLSQVALSQSDHLFRNQNLLNTTITVIGIYLAIPSFLRQEVFNVTVITARIF